MIDLENGFWNITLSKESRPITSIFSMAVDCFSTKLFFSAHIAPCSSITQIQNDNKVVIEYASRTLNKTETNYSVTEKECLAVIWGITKMRYYIEGYKFTVLTDHVSLKWLQTFQTLNGSVARWSI